MIVIGVVTLVLKRGDDGVRGKQGFGVWGLGFRV